ncbi:unnamed protein product [Toxocara canis]|uniref:OrfB_Zn_ribbon domain-containing protein n=1 Tax=Toxocara canis TaxID=6265 RepID=A0A183TWI3_TOXCA|nr:unnamed protein product [Toxocara canis]
MSFEVVQGGYKCPRCGGRELVGLNTTNAMKHLQARRGAEYAKLVKVLSHRKQPECPIDNAGRVVADVGKVA